MPTYTVNWFGIQKEYSTIYWLLHHLSVYMKGGRCWIYLSFSEVKGAINIQEPLVNQCEEKQELSLPFNQYMVFSWSFTDSNNETIDLQEIELLKGELVEIGDGIIKYYGQKRDSIDWLNNFDSMDEEAQFTIKAVHSRKILLARNRHQLPYCSQILGYAVYSNGKRNHILLHTSNGLEVIDYSTFTAFFRLDILGIHSEWLNILTEPCKTYLCVFKSISRVPINEVLDSSDYTTIFSEVTIRGGYYGIRSNYHSYKDYQYEQNDLKWQDAQDVSWYDDIDNIRDAYEGNPDNLWNTD